mmetsp:Transcript_43341/g.114088  ORF Transcript_43341/g.114088 Transcript_43341/m.114088 type:complete len:219 (-) Transcript_43341:1064-1720(-)
MVQRVPEAISTMRWKTRANMESSERNRPTCCHCPSYFNTPFTWDRRILSATGAGILYMAISGGRTRYSERGTGTSGLPQQERVGQSFSTRMNRLQKASTKRRRDVTQDPLARAKWCHLQVVLIHRQRTDVVESIKNTNPIQEALLPCATLNITRSQREEECGVDEPRSSEVQSLADPTHAGSDHKDIQQEDGNRFQDQQKEEQPKPTVCAEPLIQHGS